MTPTGPVRLILIMLLKNYLTVNIVKIQDIAQNTLQLFYSKMGQHICKQIF